MPKIIHVDEMFEILALIDHPSAASFQAALESIGSAMAATIAKELNVEAGPATFEGVAFAGTCAAFRPSAAQRRWPDPLRHYDPDSDADFDLETTDRPAGESGGGSQHRRKSNGGDETEDIARTHAGKTSTWLS